MVAPSADSPVGVLALQGAFGKHIEAFASVGEQAIEVRTAQQLESCRALVIPGGESTTILKLLKTFELEEPLAKRLAAGMPVFGTCAGMILLARSVSDGQPGQRSFGAIDIDVRRNGYGRQINSFVSMVPVDVLGGITIKAPFIRAPVVERVGPDVKVLAEHEGVAVVCRQGNVLVSSFHPELAEDDRLHKYFLDELVAARSALS